MLGTASYDVWLFVGVLLAAGLCLVPIFILMRMTRGRKKEPVVVVSFETARRHAALIWLIRGTGALIAGAAALAALYYLGFMLLHAFRGETGKLGWIGVLINILFTVLVSGGFLKIGYEMSRRVDATTVANFALISAIVVAIAFYQLLPQKIPQIVTEYVGGLLFMHRSTVALIACFGFNKVIKAFLIRVLELNVVLPPQRPAPSAPPAPIDPFVPFNPYGLSKNPAYRPPPQHL